jgi:c-di-GMP-related signal transduction protein
MLSNFLKYRTVDKVQKPSNSECYTTSSEPFRIYLNNRCLFWEQYETYKQNVGKIFSFFQGIYIYLPMWVKKLKIAVTLQTLLKLSQIRFLKLCK